MSTKAITDSVISSVSKTPLVILLLLGLGIWQATKMTDHQLEVLDRLVQVLNNAVGFGLLFIVLVVLAYAGVIYPAGKFFAGLSKELIALQKDHNAQHQEHVDASKGMFHMIQELIDDCRNIKDRIDKFYGES